jgi:CubicO group peptidase (beta-lactamase class C family)
MVTEPIGLQQTWLYTDPADDRPKNLYYRDKVLRIPLAMRSFGPDGGIVSTSSDMLIFLEAFFSGRLFPEEYLPELQKWNRIFFPLRSGIGIHLFKLPWILNPLGSVPEFIGHSGLSGALAFICPEENLLIAGTVNQVAHPDVSFRTMIKLAMVLKNR